MSKNSPKKLLNLWIPVILWAIVIFSFSAQPTQKTSEIYWQDFIVKKTAHMVEYAIFAVLLYRAQRGSGSRPKSALLYSLILAAFYGLSDEFHQSFTPGREPTLRDAIIDTIGASVALYSIWKLLPKAPKKLLSLASKLGIQ